ncbi:MAG: 2OG-Fe(II) oxygenase [Cyanobacteria bacterium J06621_12]
MIIGFKSQLQPEYLADLAHNYRQEYAQAQPFPHVVIDNFLPAAILEQVLTEFPDPQKIAWKKFDNSAEKKLASTSELQMGESTRLLLQQLNSATFINFLEQLTGIDGIIPDPYFEGGGLHQIEPGGYLKIHVDFNRHRKMRLDRRLNMLIYLNQDWQEEYGGHFEMWDTEMTQCQKKILPLFNRCVIFNTTDFSYHGNPEPLNCPEDRTRKSLALYYYSNGRPASEIGTAHSTVFKSRPQDSPLSVPKTPVLSKPKTFLKKLLPPILIDLKNSFDQKKN